jgi:LPS export ABC transporter protein LptC
MAADAYHRYKGVLLWLILGILGGIAVTTIVLMQRREIVEDVKTVQEDFNPRADATLGKIEQVSTKNGRTEWRLTADSAEMMDVANRLKLNNIFATFYLESGEEVNLTAKTGLVDTATNDIEVTGNVVIETDLYQMTTEQLAYNDQSRLLTSNAPVNLTDGASALAADGMQYDLGKNRAVFTGNVAGIFSKEMVF